MGLFFDDDRVYFEGLGVKGVLKLEVEDLTVGEEGKLDTVAEGSMPGDGAVGGSVSANDGPPSGESYDPPCSDKRVRIYIGAAVHGAWVFGGKK
ncbi:MAG: hypothetical protein LBU00_02410 [Treponema sp.]|jgi:hypothetical protein|nr:hypothetical protein [Treponema sp.]